MSPKNYSIDIIAAHMSSTHTKCGIFPHRKKGVERYTTQ